MSSIIYIATNKVNGKQYIGKFTRSLNQRRQMHEKAARQGSPLYFHRAINKYGPDAFEWRVLLTVDDGDSSTVEQFQIKARKTQAPLGYNLTAGGEGIVGLVRTPEHCAKISKGLRGRFISQETRDKLSAKNRLYRHTEEAKRKIGLAATGIKRKGQWKPTPEQKEKHRQSLLGRVVTEETRAKISEKLKAAHKRRKEQAAS